MSNLLSQVEQIRSDLSRVLEQVNHLRSAMGEEFLQHQEDRIVDSMSQEVDEEPDFGDSSSSEEIE